MVIDSGNLNIYCERHYKPIVCSHYYFEQQGREAAIYSLFNESAAWGRDVVC